MQKDQRFYLRVDEEDRRMLDAVAEAMGVQPSQAVRVLVREKHRAIFGAQPTGKPKPKARR